MSSYLGILGDPAKLEKYPDDFYNILKSKKSDNLFHLIGASEKDVTRQNYQDMYYRFEMSLKNIEFANFNLFNFSENPKDFSSRIGLFPSAANQLISGPNFVFAPYPANSNSRYLKIKAKITISVFNKFSKHNLIKVAYFPLGGKAAERTKSHISDIELLRLKFRNAYTNSWFNWIYLEAGSGEELLDPDIIENILSFNKNEILQDYNNQINSLSSKLNDIEKIIIPNTIYGGGIDTPSKLKSLLEPRGSDPVLVPECIIIGNVSENNISDTYDIIDVFDELNQVPALKINRFND